jgi:hypothetical protein
MFARCLALFAAASALAAQTAPEPASISGSVTNSLTAEPILRAHVTVHCGTEDRQHREQAYGALTNEKGEFSIAPLPPGNCSVNAERVGFVPSNRTESFTLTSGAKKEGVKLQLTPTGAITGRVVNAAGEPVEGITVMVETLGNTSVDTTDDKGEFRIGGLRPGRYRVRANPQPMPFPPEIRTDGTIEQHDTITYYPDTVDAKTAPRLEVKAGAEVSGVDIKLARTPAVRVTGTVTGIPPGTKGVMVNAQPSGHSVTVKADGTFTMWQLTPGKNTLRAQYWGGPAQLMSAPVDVEIAGANIEHVELRIVPPFDIAGEVRFDDEQAREAPKPPTRPDGTPGPAPQIHRQVQLLPLEGENVQIMGNSPLSADDSFTFERVQPARYRVMVNGTSGFVKSVRAGSTEVEGDILDVRNGAPGPVTLTMSSNFCEISGSVSDSNGPLSRATVVLASAEGSWNTRVFHVDSGTYKFRVPPGKYRLAIVDENAMGWGPQGRPDLDEYNPETVELSAGDKITRDLVERKQ